MEHMIQQGAKTRRDIVRCGDRICYVFFGVVAAFFLVSCVGSDPHQKYPKSPRDTREESIGKIQGKDLVLWADKGGGLLNPGKIIDDSANVDSDIAIAEHRQGSHNETNAVNNSKVNEYMWRAALSAVSHMPILVADKGSGLITTDWYKTSDSSNERYKINIVFHSPAFKASSIKVYVFHEMKDSAGYWTAHNVSSKMAEEVYGGILNDARRLRYFSEVQRRK